ncbi:MAG TPA: adenylate/guanylate cyclase domain-containing protein [Gaiellaceae bacterium]|nr:adenylate/guanylate cyclase domain-containing protein [Gaiellaceae bacterium]
MPSIETKRFDEPDELVSLPHLTQHVVLIGDTYVARVVHHAGWSWEEHVKPVVGTTSCMHHHQGVLLSGEFVVETDAGARRHVRGGEAYDIPPGHTAWVVGDVDAVAIEFTGARGWASPADPGERVLATLLVTDIVGSTEAAARLGDAAWKQLLARHFESTRRELDRFRGVEVSGTGDGIVAMFDGAARAVLCALALRDRARRDGLEIRAGVHSGEVERQADNVRGVAVHAAARVAAAAGAGEVLVSATTDSLLEGAGIALEDAGEHELKGLTGRRRLYRVRGGAA